ncbi:MAG: 50S ribosomal protein L22 [Bacteroides sp.]|nr:50S ribosomal protein L22 [Bacteroides sp.]MDE5805975.1 50S ribosomal protein L22 [Paramuribaculum sp.]MBD5320812.1 50S ribosomal protein L22 [Bacteroides sp.]MBD5350781.1 50S ribosomal protein L22 [Bacteroides sp.]MDE6038877.1 50S ribosomal protein L22 [Paramuribaculum sp.]
MGVRKRNSADKRKEALKDVAFAKLTNIPSSPRKMRLVADMIRGVEVNRALGLLKFSNKEAAAQLYKLLKSAIANWEAKNNQQVEAGTLKVSTIQVNCAPMLKRLRPAPQGRGYRIRKRANHVTLIVDTIENA